MMTDLYIYFRLGLSTVSNIIRLVCREMWNTLKNVCLPIPDLEKWKSIADGFKVHANFPNCIGSLDGKHIQVIKPQPSGSIIYNYKHGFLIVLLAMYCLLYTSRCV